MLAYLVLAGRDGAPVDLDVIRAFETVPDALPFLPEDRVVWSNDSGSVVFLGWQAFTEFAGIGSHWVIDDRGLTAFGGHCWPRATGWNHRSGQPWAVQLRAWAGDRSPVDIREELYGQFTLLSLPRTGNGIITPDFGGFDPVFRAENDTISAISNRSGLCARAIAPNAVELPRSLTGAGWIICHTEMFFDGETGYWDVERIPMGAHVELGFATGARIVEPQRCPLGPCGDTAAYEELLDEVDRDLRQTMRVIAELPVANRQLALSGGMDSRLLTALILDEGLQDRFRFVTFGPLDRADPMVAQQITSRFGLGWTRIDRSDRPPAEERAEVLTHTSLAEGMANAWNPVGSTTYSGDLVITGMAGEYLRWGKTSRAAMRITSEAEMTALLRRNINFDPLGIMRPDVLDYYSTTVGLWAESQLALGESIQQVPSYFNQSGQARHRFAVVQAWGETMTLTPFITPTLVRAMQRLPMEERPSHRFQIDLMRRSTPELACMPFASAGWSSEAVAHLPDAAAYLAIPPVRSAPEGKTWRVLRYEDYRPMLDEFLLDRANPIHELIDSDRLERLFPTGGRHAGRTRRLWAVLTAAVWMGNHEQHARIGRA